MVYWNNRIEIKYFNFINGKQFPLILAGDLNINYADKISERFTMSSQESTTKDGTNIDALFSRCLENIKSQTHVSYFGYHKAMVSMIKVPVACATKC